MDDSSIVDGLTEEFQCHICFDLLEDPRSPCSWGHTFCKKCLDQLVQQNTRDNRQIRCPVCRRRFGRTAIDNPVVAGIETAQRFLRILGWLRQRVAKLPTRDIGQQTSHNSTRSTRQQTGAASVRDQGQQTEQAKDPSYVDYLITVAVWVDGAAMFLGILVVVLCLVDYLDPSILMFPLKWKNMYAASRIWTQVQRHCCLGTWWLQALSEAGGRGQRGGEVRNALLIML